MSSHREGCIPPPAEGQPVCDKLLGSELKMEMCFLGLELVKNGLSDSVPEGTESPTFAALSDEVVTRKNGRGETLIWYFLSFIPGDLVLRLFNSLPR